MYTCNTIFWQVVIPTVTFGSEVWINSEKDEELLLGFQRYAGKRVQRFPQRSPNSTSYFGLGWLNLISYINVKKMIFIRSIAKMDPCNVMRRMFVHRIEDYEKDKENCKKNIYKSPCFELLKVSVAFGVYKCVKEMFLDGDRIVNKRAWSNLIWERAWQLEDANLRASNLILKDNDLLVSIVRDTKYLSWWRISDIDYYIG